MKTNIESQTDEQLWTEVLEVLEDNRRELTDEEVKSLTGEEAIEELKRKGVSFFIYRKAAAIFLATVFLGGLAFAAWQTFSKRSEQPQAEVGNLNAQPSSLNSSSDSLVIFDDLRLDSIFKVVGAHYGMTVCFRNEEAQELRMSTTWNRNQPLSEFLDILNEFDGLRLSGESDTIFVESVAVEDGK